MKKKKYFVRPTVGLCEMDGASLLTGSKAEEYQMGFGNQKGDGNQLAKEVIFGYGEF